MRASLGFLLGLALTFPLRTEAQSVRVGRLAVALAGRFVLAVADAFPVGHSEAESERHGRPPPLRMTVSGSADVPPSVSYLCWNSRSTGSR